MALIINLSAEPFDSRLPLEQFAEYTPDILWVFAADWTELLFVNESHEDIWARSIADLGADAVDFLNGVHPEYHGARFEITGVSTGF